MTRLWVCKYLSKMGRLEIWAFGIDAHLSAEFILSLKPDIAINFREERVVSADPDVFTSVEVVAALSDQNASGGHGVSRKPFDT